MTGRRIRSRDVTSGTLNPRTLGAGAVTRSKHARSGVGAEAIAPGAVQQKHLGARDVRERNVEPALIPRESVPVDQTGPVVVAESNDYPVRVGGQPMVVVTLKNPMTTAGELQFSRNGVVFATEVLAVGETLQTFGPWPKVYADNPTPVVFRPLDRARLAITNAGAGGTGFHAEWWFSQA